MRRVGSALVLTFAALALLLVAWAPPGLPGGLPLVGSGPVRTVTILYTGYGQGAVDARRVGT